MAIFSIEIADTDIARVLNAVSANYNRPETVQNPNWTGLDAPETIENPETKAMFANRMVRQFLAEHVIAYEKRIAKEQAEQNVNTSVSINDPAIGL